MMFASGCLNMMAITAGIPLAKPMTRTFSTESRTPATSDSRTGVPLRYAKIRGR